MPATELKRYQIVEGGWEPFLEVWRRIVVVRRRHGFGILFALVDREKNTFTWAINHGGDFDAAARAYYEDPERIELEIVERYVATYEIRKVAPLELPQ